MDFQMADLPGKCGYPCGPLAIPGDLCVFNLHSFGRQPESSDYVLGIVSGDSCSCGTHRQVHRQSWCSLVSARIGEMRGVMGVNRKLLD